MGIERLLTQPGKSGTTTAPVLAGAGKALGLALGLALTTAAFLPAAGRLLFLSAPQGEVFPDSLVRITIAPNPPGGELPDSCDLFHGPAIAGDRLEGHPSLIAAARSYAKDSTSARFDFKPSDPAPGGTGPQLGLGYHYLVASCRDGESLSPEIPIWIVTRQAATITSPKASEPSSSPTFAWSPVPGVPAYHLLLSDQALNIDAEKGTVSGASVIWQIITTGTSIAYGTPDPSGNFAKIPAPPLSPNVPYNLVVLNNYDGRSALATSAKAQGVKLFTLQAAGGALKPGRNLAPAPGAILTVSKDSAVTFRWTRAAAAAGSGNANTYQVFVYSRETQDGAEVLFPIWRTEVTDTSAVLDAKRTLLSRRYVWKVFAVSASGAGAAGDTTSFEYRNDVQTLTVSVNSAGVSGDTLPLGDVRIAVTPLDGSADPLPFFSNSSGGAEKTLLRGGYSLAFSKDGYVGQTRTVTLESQFPVNLVTVLPEAACRIAGQAIDQTGAGLANVTVTALSAGKRVTAVTDAQGRFLLGVTAGIQSVSLAKPDYRARPDTLLTLAAGADADLGRLMLAKASGSLTGTVANDQGSPLAGCLIAVKNAAGALERSLLTDDKGAFSAFLPPGAYTLEASRSGFTSDRKIVQLAGAAKAAFTLSPGASLVKGRISALTWPTGAASQANPLPGAAVTLTDARRGITLNAESDLRGEFTFSADTGTYVLKAASPVKALPESAVVRIAQPRSTVVRDLALRGFASILGTIRISPETVVDPAAVTVSLFSPVRGAVVATATPQLAPESGAAGAMSFTLSGIPDGNYRLSCGLAGYGLDAEPTLAVQDGIWKTGQDLMLKPAVKSVTFAVTSGGQALEGVVRLIAPQERELPAGEKLDRAPAGTYTLNAIPEDPDRIPLTGFTFFLPASGAADTTVTLDCPFSHAAKPLTLNDGEAELVLNAEASIDSAFIVFGYGTRGDTVKVPASQFSGDPGMRRFRFRPGAQGGTLAYSFILHSGGMTFSNGDAARRFHAEVEASHDLAVLTLESGDSLRLPAHAGGELRLHGFDAAGRRLDSALDDRGKIAWRADGALGLKLGSATRRTLDYKTGGPSQAAGKRGADKAAAPILTVTATLDGVAKTLKLPARVVTASVNKLVLASTLGEVAEIPDPAGFGLFVSGFDTTTTPPAPVTPDAVLSLDPPEAGTIREAQVALDKRFIGPLRILARQSNADGSEAVTELGGYRDSLSRGINVGQTLTQGDTTLRLFHGPGFEIRIPDSAFGAAQAPIRLYKRSVSKTFSSGVAYALSGNLYEISNPSGIPFDKPPRITLGLPAAKTGREHSLRRFDAARLEWSDLADSAAADTNSFGYAALSADIAEMDGSYYGLLAASRGLTAGEVRIVPNPFSPLVMATRDGNTRYGTRIRLDPESDRSAEVTVSVKIYNLDGELVRTLVDHKTVPKAPVDFYWDGRADGGRWARNGRYLVKVSVGAAGSPERKHTLKPVVLFR